MLGFQISAELFTFVSWFSTSLPPVASTWPLGSTVALTHCRRVDIGSVAATVGTGPLMSMTSARFELPPICTMRPGANIAALEVQPAFVELNCPAGLIEPSPAGATKYMLPFVS